MIRCPASQAIHPKSPSPFGVARLPDTCPQLSPCSLEQANGPRRQQVEVKGPQLTLPRNRVFGGQAMSIVAGRVLASTIVLDFNLTGALAGTALQRTFSAAESALTRWIAAVIANTFAFCASGCTRTVASRTSNLLLHKNLPRGLA